MTKEDEKKNIEALKTLQKLATQMKEVFGDKTFTQKSILKRFKITSKQMKLNLYQLQLFGLIEANENEHFTYYKLLTSEQTKLKIKEYLIQKEKELAFEKEFYELITKNI